MIDFINEVVDFNKDYSTFLKYLIVLGRKTRIVEVGVALGETTAKLCEAAAITQGFVNGYDCWEAHGLQNQWVNISSKEYVDSMLNEKGFTNFLMTKINTRTEDFSEILSNQINSIDFAFIDGCHSYIGVKTDFFALKPYFTDDCTVVFHDTQFIDGAREFIIDLRTTYNDGTFDLIDLPYGGDKNFGLAIMQYRKYPNKNLITEIAGSLSSPEEIYKKELNWYSSQINKV
jgi:hypothetical protein